MIRKLLRAVPWSIGLAVLACTVQVMAQTARDARPAAAGATAVPATTGHPPLVVLTSADDRQRVMNQLKISAFPPTPMPYQASTYDELKADPYPDLPDPLLFNNGTRVTRAAQWPARRAEIVEVFDSDVYGRRPDVTPKVTWTVATTTTDTIAGIPVITKKLVGHVDNSAYPLLTVNIIASLTVPANAKGPVPVVFGGGGDTSVPAGVTPTTVAPLCAPPAAVARAGGPGARLGGPRGGSAPGTAPVVAPADEQILRRGWGYAALNNASVQADNGRGLTAASSVSPTKDSRASSTTGACSRRGAGA